MGSTLVNSNPDNSVNENNLYIYILSILNNPIDHNKLNIKSHKIVMIL